MIQHPVSPLQINLLGPVEVRLAQADLTPTLIHKVKALLAYLAVEAERPHPRESLTGLLWPERPETVARQNLRQTLLRLRRAVGAEFIEASRKTVQFNLVGDVRLDVAEFTALVTAWRNHDHTAPEVCGECASGLEAAAALYRGDFLAQFFLEDSAPFEEWASLKREWLRTEALQALHQVAVYHEGQSDYEAARRFAWRQVELDPLREEARRQVMRLLAMQGRRSEALAQYETCRQVLEDELGVEPSAETVALVKEIRTGVLSKGARVQRSKGVGERGSKEDYLIPAPRHNLPAQTTPFVGRERELADLAQLLDEPDMRLVTIFAPGGMGKTRLAMEVAAAQMDRYPNGVYLVPLAPLSEPETMVSAIAEAVGYSFQADKRPPKQQLLDYFREKELLLVLDNFEHLLEGVDLVTAILQAAPGVRVLVTSRERLRLSGETVFSLEGMDYPEPETRPGGDYSALKLFIQSAQRVQSDFVPQGDAVEAIAQICRLVAGMPLGILLAASWAEMLTPGEIVAEIEQSFDFLEADLRDLPERQRSLRAVFAQTWRRLSEAERGTFMRLSVFWGGFTREAAQAVTGASLRTLAALVNQALLQRNPGGRYEIHELVRQYAAEQLEAASQGEAAREAHCAYYLDFLHQRQADLKGGRQLEALAEIEADHENIHLAWRWAVEQGQLDRLDQAVEGLGLFYYSQGRYLEGERACHLAGEKLAAVGDRPRILARTLTWQSLFSQKLGRGDLANHLLEQSLALLDRLELAAQDTRSERAFALLQKGQLAWYADVEEMRTLLEESLVLYRAAGDQWGTAWVLQELGRTSMVLEAYHKAKQFAAESLAIRRAMVDRSGMAVSLSVLSFIAIHQGQPTEAERFARESYPIFRDIGDPAGISQGLYAVGCAYLWLGQFAEAQALFEQSRTIIEEVGDREHLNDLNNWLAQTSLHLGQYRQAQVWGQTGLTTAKEIGLRALRGHALLQLGKVKMVEGMYTEAQQLLVESNTTYREIGQLNRLGQVLPLLGYADRGLDNIPLAQQHLAEALEMVAGSGNFFALVGALPLAALLSADRGEIERAVELYALARCYPHVANSRWYEDVAGRQIAAADETLPPEVVAAAQERGRARDTAATVGELLAELER